ncbi:hypothetical protein TcWFU_002236 [Taenia crassiceps]|uniref:Uncharacterized protein n=1 Tax=Taenia crassiceps TaxID=6207 RepID=A0ABR4QPA9_9CEST
MNWNLGETGGLPIEDKFADHLKAPSRFTGNPRYLPAILRPLPRLQAKPKEIHLSSEGKTKENLNITNTSPLACCLRLDTSKVKHFRIENGKKLPEVTLIHHRPARLLQESHGVKYMYNIK